MSERESRMYKFEELAAQTQSELAQCIEQEVERRTEVYNSTLVVN